MSMLKRRLQIQENLWHRVAAVNLPPVLVTGLLIACCSGCMQYRMGFLKHPQMQTVAIGDFENKTDEPAMAILLRKKLAEQFSTESGLQLAGIDAADIVVSGNIQSYSTERSAAAKIRDEDDLPDERSAYRTNIYKIKLRIDFETVIPGREDGDDGAPVISRSIVSEGSFPEIPDLQTSRRIGLQQALREAASQIVTSVTEAW